LKDSKWIENESSKVKIMIETDSTYILTYSDLEGSVEKRFFNKTDSGFMIRDFNGSILKQEGESKLIFPLIRFGYWRQFNSSTGSIIYEGTYRENKMISNKWWVNDKEYITNVTTDVDKNAEYEGGDAALLKFVGENLNYPIEARDNDITGRVIVSFIVMNDGTIKGIRILRNVHLLLDLEAVRVINSIPKDKWKPAEIEGRKVNFPMILPITFSIR
jgi:TonB family protein